MKNFIVEYTDNVCKFSRTGKKRITSIDTIDKVVITLVTYVPAQLVQRYIKFTRATVLSISIEKWCRLTGISWSYRGISSNKLNRMINGNGRKGLNLGFWNCRKGLITSDKNASYKKDEIMQFIKKKNLHAMCVVESDLHSQNSRIRRRKPLNKDEINRILEIPGFRIILPKSWEVHGQARVLVYVKEDLQVKIRDEGQAFSDLPTVSLEIGFGREKKTIVNYFYREFTSGVSGLMDNQSQVERFKRQMTIWRSLCTGNKDVICMGDANLCALEWLEDSYKYKDLSEIAQEFMAETSMVQVIKVPTRSEVVQGGVVSQSCIDHCYTNSTDKLSKPEVLAVGSSDHLGVTVTKYTKHERSKPNTVKKRSYKDFNVEGFLTDILESEITKNVTECDDLDIAAKLFEDDFRSILDRHAPIKVFQMRKNYSPYLTTETKLLMEERNVIKEEMTKNGDTELARELKVLNKAIAKAVKQDEKDYYKNGLEDKFDTSKAWKIAKELIGTTKNLGPTAIKKISENGEVETIRNPQKLAAMFNEFFRNKVKKLRNKTADHIPTISPLERLRKYLETRRQPIPGFSLQEINRDTFRKVMKKVKNSRVHGVDWIDGYSIKIASPLLEDCLIHLVNLSFRSNKFAACWKPQLVHPTHKKKAKDEIENYRPVSHIVQVGKIVEYAAQLQIIEHFEKYNLFHQNHHGSLANHSTATAIAQLYNSWLEAAEKKEFSAVCLLDQSAAYDLLCHKTFGEKLKLYNISEETISWVLSYLGGRTQLVQVESKMSTPLDCEDHAVPQGSILGGLFHVINSNDFPDCHEHGEGVVYVDDDSDTVHNADPVQLSELIEKEAQNSADWLTDNRLCVAEEKSKLLVISTKQLRTQKITEKMKIVVNRKQIEESSSEKLLGVVINSNLTWNNHLYGDDTSEGLVTQLSKRVGILKKLSSKMNRERLRQFAAGIFYSKLSYCLPVFGNVFGLEKYKVTNSRYTAYTMGDNHKLQVLQNKLNRLLTGAKYNTPTADLLKQTKSLSIQQMIGFQTIMMASRITKSKKPDYLSHRFQERQRGEGLRGRSGYLLQPNLSLTISREGFVNRAITLMNMLDESVRNESNPEVFRRRVYEWVKKNIDIKPKNRFQTLPRRQHHLVEPVLYQETNHPNLITRYFHIQNSN